MLISLTTRRTISLQILRLKPAAVGIAGYRTKQPLKPLELIKALITARSLFEIFFFRLRVSTRVE